MTSLERIGRAMEIARPEHLRLFQEHQQLIETVSTSLYRRIPFASGAVLDEQDFLSIGRIAGFEAIVSHDPTKSSLGSCINVKVRRLILDEVRRLSHSRNQQRGRSVRNGAAPTRVTWISLDAPLGDHPGDEIRFGDHLEDSGIQGTFQDTELSDAIRCIKCAMEDLPPRHQEVLELRFFSDWELLRIAEHLDVTESRACQLVGEGVRMLRAKFKSRF